MKRHVVVTSILVVLAFCAPFLIIAYIGTITPDRDQYFDLLHHDLETGTFAREFNTDKIEFNPYYNYFKPSAEVTKTGADGIKHHVMIYKKRDGSIYIYYKDNYAYAACIGGFFYRPVHRWYFFDEKLLAEYASLPEPVW